MGFAAPAGATSKLGVGSPEPALEQNCAFGIRRLAMQDVVSAVYKGDYRIEVTFEDGKKGIVDFAKYLEKGGVFERLRDKNFFARFEVNQELGTLSWQNEIDVAPETLYAEATDSSLPEWMEQ
jgi:hypothetical protein